MKTTSFHLHLASSFLLVTLYNTTFFRHVLAVYPLNLGNVAFLASLTTGLTALLLLLLTLTGWQKTTKPVLTTLFLLSSIIAYFTNTYDVVIDHTMIRNIVQTNPNESIDLFSSKLLVFILFLGLLPSTLVYRIEILPISWEKEILAKAKISVACVLTIFGLVFLSGNFFFSFFREHETLRYYTNPVYCLYSFGKYLRKSFAISAAPVQSLGVDAHIPAADTTRDLIILVVGEAVRADHFSLNGYPRPTNPLLQQEKVISFSNMYSSGTATAHSVPCMFSIYPREQCSEQKANGTENLLDVLHHAGVHVLWRDNNSDSKGVALRVPYQDYRQPGINTVCDVECRDEGMLVGLQDYIDGQEEGDVLIVLHQMGNHGPAYYKRYPAAYERFTPVCATNQLNECTTEAIVNAYDNAILYTDAFLAKVIGLLKRNSGQFETAMVYMGDHGESLGEYGVYLHGLPYAMAPDSQKHVASVVWFGDSFRADSGAIRAKAAERFSHDNLFHTILGLFEIETSVYNRQLDIAHSDTRQKPKSHSAQLTNQANPSNAAGDYPMPADKPTHPQQANGRSSASIAAWLLLQLAQAKHP